MDDMRVKLLDGELSLGIYHDDTEELAQDAIKLDFLETSSKPEWKIFKSDLIRIGISLSEAKALLNQLTEAIEEIEFMRPEKVAKKTRRPEPESPGYLAFRSKPDFHRSA